MDEVRAINQLQASIKRAINFLTIATIGLYLALGTLGVIGWVQLHNRAKDAAETHAFLCDQKEALKLRVAKEQAKILRTKIFLDNGGEIKGVPTSLIRLGLTDDEDLLNRDLTTLKNLQHLNCK